jgi:tetratricopeptide (TPR) repeat protein
VRQVRFYYKEAERFFNLALATRPEYQSAYYGLGLLYFETAVSREITRHVCKTPEEVAEYRWVKFVASRNMFEKAYRLDTAERSGAPQEYLAQIYNFLGIECAKRNDTVTAADHFEKSMASADLYIKWVHSKLRPKTDPKVFDFFEERVREFRVLKADLSKSLAEVYLFLGAQSAQGSDVAGAVSFYEKARRHCDLYLAWAEKEPVPGGDEKIRKERIRPVEELKGKVDKALADLGKPAAPAGT